MTLRIATPVMAELRRHLEAGYPNEACGALIGRAGEETREVIEFRPMRNTIEDRPWDRYALDPLEQLRVQKDADARGLEIIGFAHSHPDHPSRPSKFDQDHAWDFYSYIVASVQKGKLVEARSWRLDGGGAFQEESLEVN